jgi:hypothetical protein
LLVVVEVEVQLEEAEVVLVDYYKVLLVLWF